MKESIKEMYDLYSQPYACNKLFTSNVAAQSVHASKALIYQVYKHPGSYIESPTYH